MFVIFQLPTSSLHPHHHPHHQPGNARTRVDTHVLLLLALYMSKGNTPWSNPAGGGAVNMVDTCMSPAPYRVHSNPSVGAMLGGCCSGSQVV